MKCVVGFDLGVISFEKIVRNLKKDETHQYIENISNTFLHEQKKMFRKIMHFRTLFEWRK